MLNTILAESHSGTRWLVVLIALAVLVRFAVGAARSGTYDNVAKGLFTAFTVLLTIQWVLGVVYWIYYWITIGFQAAHIVHLLIMTVALGLVHMARARWGGDQLPDSDAYRRQLLTTVGSLVLVFIGVIVLPGGIARWTF
ncbi:MAG: hypothetical protein GYB64_02945 [Chloroflexi bacterium]|nr:hypothetical protein [Chloroflexota bacterium]